MPPRTIEWSDEGKLFDFAPPGDWERRADVVHLELAEQCQLDDFHAHWWVPPGDQLPAPLPEGDAPPAVRSEYQLERLSFRPDGRRATGVRWTKVRGDKVCASEYYVTYTRR